MWKPALGARGADISSGTNAGTDLRPGKTPTTPARDDLFRTAFDPAFHSARFLSVDGVVFEFYQSAHGYSILRRDHVIGRHLRETPWLSRSPKIQARMRTSLWLSVLSGQSDTRIFAVDSQPIFDDELATMLGCASRRTTERHGPEGGRVTQ